MQIGETSITFRKQTTSVQVCKPKELWQISIETDEKNANQLRLNIIINYE